MKMRKLLVGLAGLAVAGSLIGAGAGAAWQETATATQKVSTGTIDLQLSYDNTHFIKNTLALPAGDNLDSKATTIQTQVWVKNFGTVPEYFNITTIDVDRSGGILATAKVDLVKKTDMTEPLQPNEETYVLVSLTVPADSPQGSFAGIQVHVDGSDQPFAPTVG